MKAVAKGEGIYNVVVIGAGTAGLVTAAGTAGLGGRVALIERNRMGGDCLNFGCVPSKALISSARLIEKINRAEDWGLRKTEAQLDFNDVLARMRARRAQIAPNDSQERFESLGVDVFRGEAHFVSPHEIEIENSPSSQSSLPERGGRAAPGEGGQRLRAKNFVIAAGSRAAIPKMNGIGSIPYFTNETIFDTLDFKPASMIVLGGGPIGCELGQTFSRLGVKVTIVQRRDRLLPREDRDISEFLEKQFKDEGISVLTNCQVESARRVDKKIDMKISQQNMETNISAETLLICIGRQPNIEDLNLDSIGVKADKRGVKTNEYLQTSQQHIYAAGDIVGPFLFTHMADAHARVVVRNILMPFQFLRQKIDYSVVPWCTYVDPEIATVGLNETAATERNIDYDLFLQKLSEVDRAVVESEESGFVKVLVAKGTDRILGATLVCESAGDLLHEFVLAMKCGIGLGTISSTIHAYPTLAELARKVGDKYNKTRLTPAARKIFKWLYARQVS
jgi:pyruvate/2-oxoglutarate dehydrogenase complex dihydrolipoamide dehydrogenase (E3) component